jgi:hypothetical protein
MNKLFDLCKDKPWFSDVATDASGRYIVYANYIDLEVLTFVPRTFENKQVLVHFASYRRANQEYWLNTPNTTAPAFSHAVEEDDVDFLIDELERLENKTNIDIVTSIFYEIVDGDDAITDLSSKYPDIRKRIEKLYNTFGVDVLYDQLDNGDFDR